jgi:hypothetical protein
MRERLFPSGDAVHLVVGRKLGGGNQALGQSAGPHTVWRGVDDQFYLSCPKKGHHTASWGQGDPILSRVPAPSRPAHEHDQGGELEPEREIQEKEY